jgi:hypothetical protein
VGKAKGKREKRKNQEPPIAVVLHFALLLFPFAFPTGGLLSVALSRPLAERAGVPEPLPGVDVIHHRAL